MVTYQFIKNPTSCPSCQKVAVGYDAIIVDFGLRNMYDGVTRVQSWCRNCRKASYKGVATA